MGDLSHPRNLYIEKVEGLRVHEWMSRKKKKKILSRMMWIIWRQRIWERNQLSRVTVSVSAPFRCFHHVTWGWNALEPYTRAWSCPSQNILKGEFSECLSRTSLIERTNDHEVAMKLLFGICLKYLVLLKPSLHRTNLSYAWSWKAQSLGYSL